MSGLSSSAVFMNIKARSEATWTRSILPAGKSTTTNNTTANINILIRILMKVMIVTANS